MTGWRFSLMSFRIGALLSVALVGCDDTSSLPPTGVGGSASSTSTIPSASGGSVASGGNTGGAPSTTAGATGAGGASVPSTSGSSASAMPALAEGMITQMDEGPVFIWSVVYLWLGSNRQLRLYA
ncbi:MAG: hypothetical protein QM784_07140 [Polyangiaceae bacterium]